MRRFLTILLSVVALAVPTSSWEASTSANLAITVTAGQAVTAVSLSSSAFTGGAASGTVVGAIRVTMSPSSPAFSGTLSLSGTNASSFQIVGSNLETNGAVPAGTYKINIVATETGVTGSPFTQAETITGTATSSILPVLIQHVASSANPVGLGIPGNNFNIPLPNAVLASDALVLGITYPHGGTITISDTLGQTWPSAAVTADAGSGGYVAAIYVLPNSLGGNETITVGIGSSTLPFQYTLSEFNNIATSSPVNGANSGAGLAPNATTAVIDPGSFTPTTNNNANGGNVIWNYTALAAAAGGNPTNWAPASSFTLLDGDIAWTSDQGFPHASQWYIQSTQAAVDPTVTSTGDTADAYNSVSVALKVASAGGTMPSGIHINKIIHETVNAFTTNQVWNLQLPTTGNLRVLTFPAASSLIDITSITDSDGSTWSLANDAGGGAAQIWYAVNRPANPSLTVSVHISGSTGTASARFFDVQGAAVAPFDVSAGVGFTNCSSVSTINDQPTITPTTSNGLVIATMGIGQGPGEGLTSPTGGFWDLTTYSGEVDLDLMENADAVGHFYNPDTGTENWNWTITSISNNECNSEAVAFKHG
jgi:hypothetical protein